MPFFDALTEGKVERVYRDTWGHLAPESGRFYAGSAMLCRTPMGDLLLLDYDFEELDGNPWTHEHVANWWPTVMRRLEGRGPDTEVCLWRWEGTYKMLKNGTARFSAGKITPLRIVDRFGRNR